MEQPKYYASKYSAHLFFMSNDTVIIDVLHS